MSTHLTTRPPVRSSLTSPPRTHQTSQRPLLRLSRSLRGFKAICALSAALSGLTGGLTGCQDPLDLQTPEGALNSFAQALIARDDQSVYAHLSAPSKQALSDLSALTNVLNDKINALPSEAQPWARERAIPTWMSGRRALSGVQLFSLISRDGLGSLKGVPAERISEAFHTKRVLSESDDGAVVRLKTRGLPLVMMRREGERWWVASFEEPLARAVATLKGNLLALKESQGELERRLKLGLPLPQPSQPPQPTQPTQPAQPAQPAQR